MSFMSRIPIEPSEAENCVRLWQAAAAAIVSDAAAAVSKSKNRPYQIQRQMRYFRSKSWHEVCDLACISFKPAAVEAFLRSPFAQANARDTYAALGLAIEKGRRRAPVRLLHPSE